MLKIFGQNHYDRKAFLVTALIGIGIGCLHTLGVQSGKLQAYTDCRNMLMDSIAEGEKAKNQN